MVKSKLNRIMHIKVRVLVVSVFLFISVFLLMGCNSFSPSLPIRLSENYSVEQSSLPIKLAWEFKADSNLFNPIVLHNKTSVYLRTQTQIYAIEPISGQLQWQRELSSSPDIAPVTYENYLYIVDYWAHKVEALNSVTGDAIWSFDPNDYTTARSGKPLIVNIKADEQALYVVVNLRRGTDIFSLNPHTGEILSQAPLELSNSLASPGAFFVGSGWISIDTNETWILSKDLTRVIDRLPLTIKSYPTATYVSDTLYTSGDTVTAIALPEYREKWRFEDGCWLPWDQVAEAPLVVEGSIYVTTTCGLLYKLNAVDGHVVWKYHTYAGIISFATLGNVGYFVSQRASIEALDLSDGHVLGNLHVKPAMVVQPSYQHLISNQELLVLTYGNHQVFAFRTD